MKRLPLLFLMIAAMLLIGCGIAPDAPASAENSEISQLPPAEAPLPSPAKPAEYLTSGGFTVLCGRNNLMNDELTLRTAAKTDIWFHVKGMPGSHVILRRGEREMEPSDADLTEACAVAAQNSVAKGPADVDSKPRGAKPGHVIYRNYRTAHVDPDPAAVAAMKKN